MNSVKTPLFFYPTPIFFRVFFFFFSVVFSQALWTTQDAKHCYIGFPLLGVGDGGGRDTAHRALEVIVRVLFLDLGDAY